MPHRKERQGMNSPGTDEHGIDRHARQPFVKQMPVRRSGAEDGQVGRVGIAIERLDKDQGYVRTVWWNCSEAKIAVVVESRPSVPDVQRGRLELPVEDRTQHLNVRCRRLFDLLARNGLKDGSVVF